MATLPPSQAPNGQEYAGDEINALVLDPGSHSIRAGFAGEDVPKSVVPSSYAQLPSGEKLFGENAIHLAQPDRQIHNPFNDEGVIEDWETASRLCEYAITSRLTGAKQASPWKNGLNDGNGDEEVEMEGVEEQEKVLAEFPLLVSEPGWNPGKEREKMIEVAMEDWGVPAFFLAKTGQLAAYASSKATALVIDVGARNTSVTALYDGMVLTKSIHRTPLAGDFLSNQVRLMLANQQPPIPLTPQYTIKTKTPVDANSPAQATYQDFSKPMHASFHALQEERLLQSFEESVVQTYPGPGRLETSQEVMRNMIPPKPFEFPDGFNTTFSVDRFRIAEGLFDSATAYSDAKTPKPAPDTSIPSIVNKALQAVDVDTRPHLLNNVILTGAGSLITGLPERLQADIQALYPNPKVRVIATSSFTDRKFASWIGGSVLASLGSFHQMWISREEYGEFGSAIVGSRCK